MLVWANKWVEGTCGWRRLQGLKGPDAICAANKEFKESERVKDESVGTKRARGKKPKSAKRAKVSVDVFF